MFSGYMKEDDDDRDDDRYDPSQIGGTISRRDLYEMLTRSGMLGTDTFPRSDLGDIDNPASWSPREDSHHWRSAGKD